MLIFGSIISPYSPPLPISLLPQRTRLIEIQTPYLTYARTIHHPAGWKIFAFLNTLHHAFMYAYFGGAAIFSDILPWTGTLQLAVGIAVEVYVIWMGCAGEGSLWANLLAVGLLGGYAVLFSGDLRERSKEKGAEKAE